MARWEPGARERLQAAALELFATRGFEQVTAAEIAQSVGLTERTFFRHFSDKREVLFYGQQQFLQAFVGGVDAAPPDASPLEIIASALHAAASFFPDERRPYSRMRQSVIDQNPALRERELHKLANLAATVAEALRARGIGEPAATLAAQSGATVFGIAFAQWIREGETRSLPDIASDVVHELHTLTAAATGSPNLPIAGTHTSRPRPHRLRYGSLPRLSHETHSLTWIRSTQDVRKKSTLRRSPLPVRRQPSRRPNGQPTRTADTCALRQISAGYKL